MYKRCVSLCIVVGMLLASLLIGHSALSEDFFAGKNLGDLKKRAAEKKMDKVLDGCISVLQSDRIVLPFKIIVRLYEVGGKGQLADEDLAECFRKLLEDDLLEGGSMELTSYEISDVDQNGQNDMIIMTARPGYSLIDAPGCIYIYFNDEPLYCFRDDDYNNKQISTYNLGFYDACQAGDIDNDGKMELVVSIYNGGNGGPGGCEYIILKNEGHTFEEMELPEALGKKHLWKLEVSVCMGDRENQYEAYCPYLDDTIEFSASNAYPFESRYAGRGAGGNYRGLYNYRCVAYEGGNALQCSEYLHGEGGGAHGVGIAKFIIAWDKDGSCEVVKWWIE